MDRQSDPSREVRIARQVSHPNVCRIYDIGVVDGMPFISIEYVDGEDLASLLLLPALSLSAFWRSPGARGPAAAETG